MFLVKETLFKHIYSHKFHSIIQTFKMWNETIILEKKCLVMIFIKINYKIIWIKSNLYPYSSVYYNSILNNYLYFT